MKLANLIIFLFLFIISTAIAETSGHQHAGHTMSPEMKKQHEAMATISKQWKVCKNALHYNNFKDAGIAVETIIEAAADIENFKLHKNTDDHKQFSEHCNAFGEKIIKLNNAIKTGDVNTAEKTANAVEESCRQCHIKFR
jgi:cytochrome c556